MPAALFHQCSVEASGPPPIHTQCFCVLFCDQHVIRCGCVFAVISSVIMPKSGDSEDKDEKDATPEDIEGKLRDTQQQIEEYKGR